MKLFLSNTIGLIVGLLIATLAPALILYPFYNLLNPTKLQFVSFSIIAIAHLMSTFTASSLLKFPGVQSALFIIPPVALSFTVCILIAFLFRLPYSITYIGMGFLFSIFFRFVVFFLQKRYNKVKMAFIPLGDAKNLYKIKGVEWIRLASPSSDLKKSHAIVVDLYYENIGNIWHKFLAKQTLEGTPVYNARQVEESLTGRVKIRHMHENDLGALQPSPIYMLIKKIADFFMVFITLPLTLPIFLFTSLAIKLDDGGAIFYTQDRIGYRGRVFKVYKFRSMKEKSDTQITKHNDKRITSVGRFIRKTRIDELPQFLNVIKGEMSLIGPRAEYKAFADEFEKVVPFYQYRHIVKPGISGWAQVKHGYVASVEETKVKIEHDFYYIKNYSFSLDVLIFFKTIQTIFTGFGAR